MFTRTRPRHAERRQEQHREQRGRQAGGESAVAITVFDPDKD
jgi:hypothetical protein